jgi:hypothetical protein
MSNEGWDWEKVEAWIVEKSGNLSLRQIAEKSSELACFDYRSCSYEKVREKGKEGLWFQKRAKFQAEKHGGILEDYRASYDIITRAIQAGEGDEDMSPRDLAALGQLQLKYGEAIMAINPPSSHADDINILTSDDVKAIIREEELGLEPVDFSSWIAEETPID